MELTELKRVQNTGELPKYDIGKVSLDIAGSGNFSGTSPD